ncbi:hypothetical protein M378DRAFT_540620 [Amanita muscaria Koide BX008]|uniref:Uncharacterized protein n=1 Tax=Amanita muscaria (strain Koide BX008) TaxID=946122 RepID=A0A0C2SQ30_AMAMK|nr:hypothetical protein M378DRAFT_540620 [Amanita muscaria Koide BX008]
MLALSWKRALGEVSYFQPMKNVMSLGSSGTDKPVAKYWEEILYDYIMTDKFNPSLFASLSSSYNSLLMSSKHRVPLNDQVLFGAFPKTTRVQDCINRTYNYIILF